MQLSHEFELLKELIHKQQPTIEETAFVYQWSQTAASVTDTAIIITDPNFSYEFKFQMASAVANYIQYVWGEISTDIKGEVRMAFFDALADPNIPPILIEKYGKIIGLIGVFDCSELWKDVFNLKPKNNSNIYEFRSILIFYQYFTRTVKNRSKYVSRYVSVVIQDTICENAGAYMQMIETGCDDPILAPHALEFLGNILTWVNDMSSIVDLKLMNRLCNQFLRDPNTYMQTLSILHTILIQSFYIKSIYYGYLSIVVCCVINAPNPYKEQFPLYSDLHGLNFMIALATHLVSHQGVIVNCLLFKRSEARYMVHKDSTIMVIEMLDSANYDHSVLQSSICSLYDITLLNETKNENYYKLFKFFTSYYIHKKRTLYDTEPVYDFISPDRIAKYVHNFLETVSMTLECEDNTCIELAKKAFDYIYTEYVEIIHLTIRDMSFNSNKILLTSFLLDKEGASVEVDDFVKETIEVIRNMSEDFSEQEQKAVVYFLSKCWMAYKSNDEILSFIAQYYASKLAQYPSLLTFYIKRIYEESSFCGQNTEFIQSIINLAPKFLQIMELCDAQSMYQVCASILVSHHDYATLYNLCLSPLMDIIGTFFTNQYDPHDTEMKTRIESCLLCLSEIVQVMKHECDEEASKKCILEIYEWSCKYREYALSLNSCEEVVTSLFNLIATLMPLLGEKDLEKEFQSTLDIILSNNVDAIQFNVFKFIKSIQLNSNNNSIDKLLPQIFQLFVLPVMEFNPPIGDIIEMFSTFPLTKKVYTQPIFEFVVDLSTKCFTSLDFNVNMSCLDAWKRFTASGLSDIITSVPQASKAIIKSIFSALCDRLHQDLQLDYSRFLNMFISNLRPDMNLIDMYHEVVEILQELEVSEPYSGYFESFARNICDYATEMPTNSFSNCICEFLIAICNISPVLGELSFEKKTRKKYQYSRIK